MRKLAFLSMDNMYDFVSDDELAIEPLRQLGWDVETISWRQPQNWQQYEMVIIRTPWDYQNDAGAFLKTLEQIAASGAQLHNNLETVRWNIAKTYLRDLENRGNRIVPTIWENGNIAKDSAVSAFTTFDSEEIIIKPVISANADNTFRLRPDQIDAVFPQLQNIFSHRPFMIQPFLKNVISEGEFSLFYFGGEYSHTILKTPKTGDFRVQEEHGGIITAVQPSAGLKAQADAAIGSLPEPLLYARIDFVRLSGDHFAIMEMELIEPALYFRMDEPSATRFAKTVARWLDDRSLR